ncbi:MAG: (Fe-S)-binding protein [Candidatus Jordarchaeum sp.]|uniref:(Fe-S)-binding protein n=1 Tax=Candidatus Jordarchaeum sp. TaxID=2823881 RepID=UPI00404B1D6A
MPEKEIKHIEGILQEEDITRMEPEEDETYKKVEACQNCGLCLAVCPILEVIKHESYSGPRSITSELSRTVREFWKAKDVVYFCTQCGRCQEICSKNVPVPDMVTLIRSKLFEQRRDLVPESFEPMLQNLKEHGLAFEPMEGEARVESAQGRLEMLGLPYMPDKIKSNAEVLYFPGCQADNLLPEIRESAKLVLEKLGVDYTLLPGLRCCSLPAILMGDSEMVDKLEKDFLEKVENLGVKTVVTTCAGCTATLEGIRQRNNADFEVKHIIEYIIEDFGREKFEKLLKNHPEHVSVTLHSPCHLDRHVGKYTTDYAEEILEILPNVEIKRLEDPERCCGAGGLLNLYNPQISRAIVRKEIEDIQKSGAQKVVTPCPLCLVQIDQALFRKKAKTEALDYTVFLAKRLYGA